MLEFTWAELKCDLQKCDFRVCVLLLIPMLQARTAKVTCQCGSQLGSLSSQAAQSWALCSSLGQRPWNGDQRIQDCVPGSSPMQPRHTGDARAMALWLVMILLRLPGLLESL